MSALAKNTFASGDTCITGILTGKSIECKSSNKFMSWGQPGLQGYTFSGGLREDIKSLCSRRSLTSVLRLVEFLNLQLKHDENAGCYCYAGCRLVAWAAS